MISLHRRLLAALSATLILIGGVLLSTSATAAPTSGSGGPQTDQTNLSFTSGGVTSTYHRFAAGLDWTKEVGLLMYADGSGGYGLDNPNNSYLLDADGTAGLVAVAKRHNMVLVTPLAPAPGCPSDNCWYNGSGTPSAAAKAAWSSALISYVKSQYPIELDRVAVGGYSSGAQWTTRYFLPAHGEAQSVDLAVPIGGGGTPITTPQFSAGYKAATVVAHDTGTADVTPTYSAYEDAQRGEAWYRSAGFPTDPTWPAGVTHSRGGEFAGIVDREITQHIRPAGTGTPPVSTTPTTPTTPTTTAPAEAPWDTTITPARTTATAVVNDVPAGTSRVTFRMSATPFGTQTGFYQYCTGCTGDVTLKLSPADLTPGKLYYWQIESGTSRTVKDSGTFTTLP